VSFNGNGSDSLRRPESRPTSAQATSDALLDAVDVRVETYLGETSMTIAQLNELKAGGVITLGATLDEPVELRVNGVRVARGELVAVGDKFGVRIISLA
jgi:flagellar motor switch protein FliN/FliY